MLSGGPFVMGAQGVVWPGFGLIMCGYLALFTWAIIPIVEAGCGERESPNCCTGRNNECFEYTKRKTVCYCDTYCQKTGDCCDDYQRVCQISGEFPASLYACSMILIIHHHSEFEICCRDRSQSRASVPGHRVFFVLRAP